MRPVAYDRDVGKSRRRIDDDGDAAADHDGATTCSIASDEDVDHSMDCWDEIDSRILASLIMSVDVTEVFGPARVNRLAAKFGLVPGASLKGASTPCCHWFSPCTMFSNLQELNTYVHRDDPELLKAFEE